MKGFSSYQGPGFLHACVCMFVQIVLCVRRAFMHAPLRPCKRVHARVWACLLLRVLVLPACFLNVCMPMCVYARVHGRCRVKHTLSDSIRSSGAWEVSRVDKHLQI